MLLIALPGVLTLTGKAAGLKRSRGRPHCAQRTESRNRTTTTAAAAAAAVAVRVLVYPDTRACTFVELEGRGGLSVQQPLLLLLLL